MAGAPLVPVTIVAARPVPAVLLGDDILAAFGPDGCGDAIAVGAATHGVKLRPTAEIAVRGAALAISAVAAQHSPIAVVDHHQTVAAIAVGIERVANEERALGARFVIVVAIAAAHRLGIAVIAIVGAPAPRLGIVVLEGVIGRRATQRAADQRGDGEPGIAVAAGVLVIGRVVLIVVVVAATIGIVVVGVGEVLVVATPVAVRHILRVTARGVVPGRGRGVIADRRGVHRQGVVEAVAAAVVTSIPLVALIIVVLVILAHGEIVGAVEVVEGEGCFVGRTLAGFGGGAGGKGHCQDARRSERDELADGALGHDAAPAFCTPRRAK